MSDNKDMVYLVITNTYGDYIDVLMEKGVTTWEQRRNYKYVTSEKSLMGYDPTKVKIIFGRNYFLNETMHTTELNYLITVRGVELEHIKW